MARYPQALEKLGDSALAALARSNDTAAFAELWRRHVNAGTAAARQFSSIADPQDIVSEAYLRILRALQQGGGPHEAFRPYLYRTIRNIALDWRDRRPSVSLEETPELVDTEHDPQVSVVESHLTAQAFEALPERWRAVLWYLEVEDMSPSEAAPLLGISPNATSVLAGRAHEGFKKAWLQAHVNDRSVPPDCRWTTDRMGDYVRRTLTKRSRARFDRHLEDCERCSLLITEIGDLGGRLAAVLLPAALGATAGSALLGQFLQRAPTAPLAPRAALGRKALTAGVGAVSLALIATGAFAITTLQQSARPPTAVNVDDPTPASSPIPAPPTTRQPTSSGPTLPPPPPPAPPRPPVTVVPEVPPPAPDRTPPAQPVLVEPVDGLLTTVPLPTFSGVGEPGATVVVERRGALGTLNTVLSTVVAPDGRWSGTLQQPLADGAHELLFSQVDRAGNGSAAVSRTITVDSVALAPVVDALPASPMLFLPVVSGQAEPGATISIHDETETVVATTTANEAGVWSVPLPDPERDGATISAFQQDRAGNTSPSSTASLPLSFVRPEIVSPAADAGIPSAGGSTVVEVQIAGETGRYVQVFIDGLGTGNVHQLEAGPILRVTPPLADGAHTIGLRYFDPDTGQAGSVRAIAILIS